VFFDVFVSLLLLGGQLLCNRWSFYLKNEKPAFDDAIQPRP
jgi:hypothetical protein